MLLTSNNPFTMKTKIKKLTPKQIAQEYLKKSNFFDYQKYPDYQKKLDQQIKKALSHKNALNLILPHKEITPLANQTSFYTVELGGTFLHLYQSKIAKGKIENIIEKVDTKNHSAQLL